MKNATKIAEDLKSLCRRVVKEHKPDARQPQDPLQALVRGAMSFDMPDTRAEDAMRAINHEFVDLNELRVATDLEIQELLGVRYPVIERRVAMITQSLNAIFEKEHTLNLERLKTVSRRDVRQFLRDLPDMHPFVEAYVLMFGFDGHAFPMDEQLLAYLRDNEIFDEKTTVDEAQKFVEHHLKSEECYELFTALRAIAAEADAKARKKQK